MHSINKTITKDFVFINFRHKNIVFSNRKCIKQDMGNIHWVIYLLLFILIYYFNHLFRIVSLLNKCTINSSFKNVYYNLIILNYFIL